MPMVGMQRMQAPGMAGYNLNPSGMGGGMNPSGIPMQRGVANQAQQQQVHFLDLILDSYLELLVKFYLIHAVAFQSSLEGRTQEWEWLDTLRNRNKGASKVGPFLCILS